MRAREMTEKREKVRKDRSRDREREREGVRKSVNIVWMRIMNIISLGGKIFNIYGYNKMFKHLLGLREIDKTDLTNENDVFK